VFGRLRKTDIIRKTRLAYCVV